MRINEPINYANHCPRRLRPLPKIFFIGLTTWPRLFWEIGASTFAGAATPLNFLGRPYPTSYVYSRQFSRRPWITKEYHIRSPGWRISHFQGALAHPIAFGCSELCQGLGLVMLGCSIFCFGERHGSQMMSVESVDKVDNSASSSIGFTSFYFHFQWTCIYNSLISDRGSANVLSETNCPGGWQHAAERAVLPAHGLQPWRTCRVRGAESDEFLALSPDCPNGINLLGICLLISHFDICWYIYFV